MGKGLNLTDNALSFLFNLTKTLGVSIHYNRRKNRFTFIYNIDDKLKQLIEENLGLPPNVISTLTCTMKAYLVFTPKGLECINAETEKYITISYNSLHTKSTNEIVIILLKELFDICNNIIQVEYTTDYDKEISKMNMVLTTLNWNAFIASSMLTVNEPSVEGVFIQFPVGNKYIGLNIYYMEDEEVYEFNLIYGDEVKEVILTEEEWYTCMPKIISSLETNLHNISGTENK